MYVDLQVNGHAGVDFSDPALDADAFRRAAAGLLADGTDIFLPTLITMAPDPLRRAVGLVMETVAREGWESHIPGVHLEGPFINPAPGAVGCHPPEWVRPPSMDLLDEVGGAVRLVTVAADVAGVEDFIRAATARGIVVSLGHHLADSGALARAAAAGARALTHLGNGLPNLLDRHRNPIWAGLANDDLSAFVITDGHHLPPEVVKCVLRCKGVGRTIVTSDQSSPTGLPPGRYRLLGGNDAVLEPDGRLHNPAKGCLVGSASTMRMCMEYLASLELLTPEELRRVGRDNALELLNRQGGKRSEA